MKYEITRSQYISKNCMVCGVDNPFGLKARFFETDAQEVVALVTLGEQHQSYPGIAHGGVSATLLDEVIGRAIMCHHDQNTFGVTLGLEMKYRLPVPLGVELKIVGRIIRDGRIFTGSGELYLPDGQVAVTAAGKYMLRRVQQITDKTFVESEWFPDPGAVPGVIAIEGVDAPE
jgi:uncharacterized protein (TIGR00369 family)